MTTYILPEHIQTKHFIVCGRDGKLRNRNKRKYIFFFFFPAAPCSFRDRISSLTRDWTWAHGSESAKS